MAPRESIAVLIVAAAALMTIPAAAQEVGTTTAVNPLSEGTTAAGRMPLTVGARIIHNERVHTATSGTAQLRFLDKSSLSIGPNSNLVINEFVYTPGTGSGHMTASLAQGAFRFVGGMVSHEGEASFITTAAVIGVRG